MAAIHDIVAPADHFYIFAAMFRLFSTDVDYDRDTFGGEGRVGDVVDDKILDDLHHELHLRDILIDKLEQQEGPIRVEELFDVGFEIRGQFVHLNLRGHRLHTHLFFDQIDHGL